MGGRGRRKVRYREGEGRIDNKIGREWGGGITDRGGEGEEQKERGSEREGEGRRGVRGREGEGEEQRE